MMAVGATRAPNPRRMMTMIDCIYDIFDDDDDDVVMREEIPRMKRLRMLWLQWRMKRGWRDCGDDGVHDDARHRGVR